MKDSVGNVADQIHDNLPNNMLQYDKTNPKRLGYSRERRSFPFAYITYLAKNFNDHNYGVVAPLRALSKLHVFQIEIANAIKEIL